MKRYLIAGLKVDMQVSEPRMVTQGAKYLANDTDGEADIIIAPSRERLEKRAAETPGMTLDLQEYMTTGARFYVELIRFGGFMLHASAVVVDHKAYLFSAPSGTGKSTHTSLWLEHFGTDRAFILNDDKPAVRFENGRFTVSGTPWSGKNDCSANVTVPIAGVAFIERSQTNRIEQLSVTEAIQNIMWQTVRPSLEHNMEALLSTLDKFISQVPIYKLYCNISDQAVEVAYDQMRKER